jgi:hypothetical protein
MKTTSRTRALWRRKVVRLQEEEEQRRTRPTDQLARRLRVLDLISIG